jgi:ankyrin repeat protein
MQERKRLKENALPNKLPIKADIAKSDKPALSKEEQKRLDVQLLKAAKSGETDEIQRLLKAGANINAKDDGGWTALFYAARWGRTETCSFLIESGADVNAKDDGGWTAFILAAIEGNTETVAFLKLYPIRKMLGNEADMFISSFNDCIAG